MFAFFGLGTQELIALGILGGMFGVGTLLAIFLIVRPSRRMTALEEENRRLRTDLDRDEPRRPAGGV